MQEELKITWGECLDSELPIRSGTPLPPQQKYIFTEIVQIIIKLIQ